VDRDAPVVSIGRAAAHGVAWNMVFGIGSRVLTLISTLVLTRFIAPDDYGAVLAASIAVVTAGVLTSFAFGQYLIAKRSTPDVCFQAALVHVVIGVVAMAVLVALRDPIGELLDTPEMGQFVFWYALAHVIDRARYVPERLLMRDLRFRAIAMINGTGELLFAGVALALAPRYGADAIVIAVQVRAVFAAVAFFATSPRAAWLVPSRLDPEVVRGLFGYGLPIMVAAISDRAATRWDNLIISKLFGPGVMARYNLAYSLAEMPVSHVAEHIGEVLMPSFSLMEDAQRRSAVVRAAALMALVVSPLGVGLGAVAPTLVEAFFDERWAGMAPLLVILSVMTVFRPMTWSPVAYLQAIQQTRLIMFMSFARAVLVLPLVAAFGAAGGPEWACVGGCIGYAVHSLGTIVVAGRATGLPIADFLAGVIRPLVACAPMVAAVLGVEAALDEAGAPIVVSLIAQIVAGGLVYVASAFVFARPTAREMIRLGKGVIRRDRS
jgi:PST family polysaccharide transporter